MLAINVGLLNRFSAKISYLKLAIKSNILVRCVQCLQETFVIRLEIQIKFVFLKKPINAVMLSKKNRFATFQESAIMW
jgi:hypothetical protein